MSLVPLVQISLNDARLIQRLRAGEPGAFDGLWSDCKDPVWSVCLHMSPEQSQALHLLRSVYGSLAQDVRGWGTDWSVNCQLSAGLWRRIALVLELSMPASIDVDVPPILALPNPQEIRSLVSTLPMNIRLVYLLDLFFGCPAPVLGGLLSVDEQELRDARGFAAFTIAEGRHQGGGG